MLKEAKNEVVIQGILSQVDLEEATSKEGKPLIRGTVYVKVTQDIGGETIENEIPIRCFSMKYKKDGNINPAYNSILKVKNEFTSIAASQNGVDGATRVRVSGAKIIENVYPKDEKLISYPQIQASFFNSVEKDKAKEEAKFEVEAVIKNIKDETNRDGEETGRLIVNAIIPKYGEDVDIVDIIVANKSAIDYIRSNWSENDTVRINGKLNFTFINVTQEVESAFGEPVIKEFTRSVSELILTGGSDPYDEGEAYTQEDVKKGRAKRKERVEKAKAEREAAKAEKEAVKETNGDDYDF